MPPPSAPIPRVAPGKHVGFITKIDISADGRFALTVSEDKTARVWDVANRRLHRTLRVPIAGGHEGRLYVGAINPAGTLAAVGGFTGMASGTGAIIYLHDLTTDRLVPIQPLPEAGVDNLLFSRDGRYLAAAFADGHGLMVLDLIEQRMIAHTNKGSDRILGIDFGPANDLVVSSVDGGIKKYAGPDFDLAVEISLASYGEPMHVRYSPDDTQLAVGYRNAPYVSILSAATLEETQRLDASHLPGLAGLTAAEWSGDGNAVFAGGRTQGNMETPLIRWDLARGDPPATVLMAPKQIGDIHRLPEGGFIYVTGMPTVGLVDATGAQQWLVENVTADIRADDETTLKLSADGLSVQFPFDRAGRRLGNFSPLTIDPTLPLTSVSVDASALYSRANDHPAWSVRIDSEAGVAELNGATVALEPREIPRTYALARDAREVFLGTAWFLRAYDTQSQLVWRTELSGEVELLNTSLDGRWVVAALSDGTLRWFRTRDGKELLALFPHVNGNDWIAWIPEGYYMSSLYGDEYIGWHVNRGWAQAPDFYKAVQFERILYRPDVVVAYLQSYGDPESITALLGENSFAINQLDDIAPATIVADWNPDTGVMNVSAESSTLPMQEISVYVDGIPINAGNNRSVQPGAAKQLRRSFPLPAQIDSRVRIEIANGKSIGIEELWVQNPNPTPQPKGDLYLLAVGVSEFDDEDVPRLLYAAKDAHDVARTFGDRLASPFANIHIEVIADGSDKMPTGKQIRQALNFVQRAGPQDTAILFFASHGLTVDENYYFAPFDARIDVPPNRGDGLAIEEDLVLESFLSWDEIFEPMRLAAGKRLMIVDTCASGSISGPADLFDLQKRSASSKIAFMTASAGNQLSQELNRKRQGLFTFTLLTGLRDAYDPNADGIVSLNEVFMLSQRMVPNWRENKALPQTPQLMAPDFLADMALAVRPAAEVIP